GWGACAGGCNAGWSGSRRRSTVASRSARRPRPIAFAPARPWNGHGVARPMSSVSRRRGSPIAASTTAACRRSRGSLPAPAGMAPPSSGSGRITARHPLVRTMRPKQPIRWCAVYTRKSSEEGLEQDFNSLDAQREAGKAYVQSQRHEGWRPLTTHYDDGGYSGGTLDRPALQRLLADIRAGKVQIVVVYKVDRLTRSLADFAKLIELFEAHGVSFVSVTQQFNTTTSMGRLMLNVLLSFAQFEREVTGERIRDKIAASK